MARSSKTLQGRGGSLVPPTITLALWRLRRSWGLLFITGLGIVSSVILVCTVPLYSEVSMTAGLRGVINANPANADIVVGSRSGSISSTLINTATQHLNQEFKQNLGPYLGSPQFVLTQLFANLVPNTAQNDKGMYRTNGERTVLSGADMTRAASHLNLIQGRLPLPKSSELEIAVLPDTLASFKAAYNADIGSVLPLRLTFIDGALTLYPHDIQVRIVGTFTLPATEDPFWHGEDFVSQAVENLPVTYRALVSNDTLLSQLTQFSETARQNNAVIQTQSTLSWFYRLDTSKIAIDNLADIITAIHTVQVDDANNPEMEYSPFIEETQTYLPSDVLDTYSSRVSIAQLPVNSLLLLMLGLVLFFVSMMADLLVDRQSETIALIRSRGASRQQVIGALVMQGIGLALVALLIGPLLAISVVRFLAQNALSPVDQSAIALIDTNPVQVVLGLRWYALAAAGTTILALTLAVFRATSSNVLSMRREAARSTHRPLWQRLNLDIVAAIIAIIGYIFSVYLTNAGILDPHLSLLLLSPLNLLGLVFLLIAAMLFFLRFFPGFLHLGSWIAVRGRAAPSMLALAQMSRAPRQSVRMTLLLALATAFTIFSFVLTASQSQRIQDVAAFQSGADFSGTIPGVSGIVTGNNLADVTSQYDHVPGVRSASLGYLNLATAGSEAQSYEIDFRAVDSDTFAKTATWTEQDSTQSLDSLMKLLSSQRSTAIASKLVPAIVDANTWKILNLSPGAAFTLSFSLIDPNNVIHFVAVAEVQHIPTVTGDSVRPTVLTDYKTYAMVYAEHAGGSSFTTPLNYVWLRTGDTPAELASVRKALTVGDLQLSPYFDRRAILDNLYHEPLYLDLIGVLSIGGTIAILLALVGSLIASWLSARSRLTNFAILRALGTSPRQIASVLTWEQSVIYVTALGLGLLFGFLLANLGVPSLIFTSVVTGDAGNQLSKGGFYLQQIIPPIQIIIPSTIALALGLIVIICVLALGMMIRIVSRPSIGQTLRLNED